MRSAEASQASTAFAHVRSVPVRAAHVDAAEAREQLLRVAARDREADALTVGNTPDARCRRAWVEAQLGLQPWHAAGRQLAHERVEALVVLAKRATDEHLEVSRGEAGLERSGRSAVNADVCV
jgi:hypothetical protein